jgi:hypothetical protein
MQIVSKIRVFADFKNVFEARSLVSLIYARHIRFRNAVHVLAFFNLYVLNIDCMTISRSMVAHVNIFTMRQRTRAGNDAIVTRPLSKSTRLQVTRYH